MNEVARWAFCPTGKKLIRKLHTVLLQIPLILLGCIDCSGLPAVVIISMPLASTTGVPFTIQYTFTYSYSHRLVFCHVYFHEFVFKGLWVTHLVCLSCIGKGGHFICPNSLPHPNQPKRQFFNSLPVLNQPGGCF